jgi:hypothetical protein
VSPDEHGKALVSTWEDHVILTGPILEIHCGHAVFNAVTSYLYRLREVEAMRDFNAGPALIGERSREERERLTAQGPAHLIVEYDMAPRGWYLVDQDGTTVRSGEMA